MECVVTLSTDICLPLYYAGPLQTMHNTAPVPPSPLPSTPLPHVEIPTPMLWPPGYALMQNKFTTTVKHAYRCIVLDGHDCGYMIVHVPVPPAPPSLMLLVVIPFSSRKLMFASSTVKMNGTCVGLTQLLLVPTPMMACVQPISVPIAVPPGNLLNSVSVKMSIADYIAGVISIGLSMVADYISNKISTSDGGLRDEFFAAALGGSNPREWLVKQAAGALSGLARMALTGEGSVQVGLGGPYLGVGVSYGQTQVAGADGVSRTAHQAGFTSQGGPVQAQGQQQWNPDGTTQTQGTITTGTPGSQHSEQRTVVSDSQGRTTSDTRTSTDTRMVDGLSGTESHSTATNYDPATGTRTTTTTDQSVVSGGGALGGGDRSSVDTTTRDGQGNVTQTSRQTTESSAIGPGNIGGVQTGEQRRSESTSTVSTADGGNTTTTTDRSSSTTTSMPFSESETTSSSSSNTTTSPGAPRASGGARTFGEPL